MKTIENIPSAQCTGCYGCVNVCSKNAISMEVDKRGFVHPYINHIDCIDCGLCYKRCPIISKPIKDNSFEVKAFSVCADKETCLKSTSGGAFSVFAKYVLSLGGVVFGARSNGLEDVWHEPVDSLDDLDLLRRSKYFQSNISLNYRVVKKYLLEGRLVLFCGTPCQVGALKNYLNKDYENLITLDLVCHGVPSKNIFLKFKREIEIKKSAKMLAYYRDSSQWAPTIFSTEYARSHNELQPYSFKKTGKTKWKETFLYDKDLFNHLYHSNLIQRRSCQDCKFCTIPRMGEITIGDDWDYYSRHVDDPGMLKYGRSYIMVNNRKGTCLLQKVKFDDIELTNKIGGLHITIPPKPNYLSNLFFIHNNYSAILPLVEKYTISKPIYLKLYLRICLFLRYNFEKKKVK